MSNSHGELFTEIGRLVLAANSGQPIDLSATVKDLAQRYENLGMTEETLMKVVSRSIGAISFSMARGNGGLQSRLEALHESQTAPKPAEEVLTELAAAVAQDVSEAASAPAKAAKPAPASGGRRPRRAKAAAAPAPAEATAAKSKSLFPSGVRLAVLS